VSAVAVGIPSYRSSSNPRLSMSTSLSIWEEAVALCADLEDKLLELGMIEAILSSEVHGAAKAESMETSRDLHTSVPRVSGVWTLTPT
jgi:hypothetical protein